MTATAQVHAAIRKHTEIPPESLDLALRELAKDRGFQLVYLTENVAALQTRGAIGDFTVDEALKKLLSDSRLEYKFVDDDTVSIFPKTNPTSALGGDRTRTSGSDQDSSGSASKRSTGGQFHLAQVDPGTSVGPSAVSGLAANAQQGANGADGISEIIVTAQKKSERLQDVPVPVTVLDADTLADSGKVLIKDYFSSIPGFSFQPSILGTSNYAIRGITTSGFTNPTVGVTVDDVPYGASTQGLNSGEVPDIDPGDLAQVEILRGPQGTLYGANSMGGLIKFVTKDPSTDAFSGRVETGASTVYNGAQPGYVLRASFNIPLTDTLAVRASAFTRQDPGYIDNPITGINGVNEAQNEGARLGALWRPSENFSLKLSALYQHSKTLGGSDSELMPGLGGLQTNDLKDSNGYDRTIQAYSATLDYKVHDIDLTSVTGYNIGRTFNTFDYTSFLGVCCTEPTSLQYFGVGVTGTKYANQFNLDKFTQELRAKTAIGPVELLIGGFYNHESAPGSDTIVYAENDVSSQVAGVLLRTLYTGPAAHFEEYAGFANLTYHVTERFDVQFGGRESQDKEVDTPQFSTGPYVPIIYGVTPLTFTSPQIEAKGNAFTYLVTPRFQISPDFMVYARAASGYRPGGANTPGLTAQGAPATFNPDKTQNYEIGAKADFLDHKLSIDTSVFYIDWKNLQLQLLTLCCGSAYAANGGAAKSEGVEFSVAARPLQGLSISAWLDYTNAVLKDDMPAHSSVFGLSGARLPLSSRVSGSVSAEQDFPVSKDLTAFVGGQVSYVGDRLGQFQGWSDPAQTMPLPRQRFPGYAKTDILFGIKDDPWKVSLYVNNLADKRGVLNAGATDLYNPNAVLYIVPRTIGLSAVRTF